MLGVYVSNERDPAPEFLKKLQSPFLTLCLKPIAKQILPVRSRPVLEMEVRANPSPNFVLYVQLSVRPELPILFLLRLRIEPIVENIGPLNET